MWETHSYWSLLAEICSVSQITIVSTLLWSAISSKINFDLNFISSTITFCFLFGCVFHLSGQLSLFIIYFWNATQGSNWVTKRSHSGILSSSCMNWRGDVQWPVNTDCKRCYMETSLVIQGLRLCASTARSTGSILGRGNKIPHAAQHGQKIK